MKNIAIIGGGPAGLYAAEVAAKLGACVDLYDAMPSVGRKFLVAGKSGLNLTHDEPIEPFLKRYSGNNLPRPLWQEIIENFDNHALRKWAADLGIETFVASSGKVFPSPDKGSIKAAPLLRHWIKSLRDMGVTFHTRHTWTAFKEPNQLTFSHQGTKVSATPDATILALGGASWPQTGSTGSWVDILKSHDISTTPLSSANCGWEVAWPAAILKEAEGLPLKNLSVSSGERSRHGEMVITRDGLEGGPLYHLGPHIRQQPEAHIIIDFKPHTSHQDLVSRMGKVKRNFVREARRRWNLDSATCSILKHMPDRGPWQSVEQLAREIKNCRIPLTGPRPIAEAISSAGGICWEEINDSLMLKKIPYVYVAGEMMDWEAPTGGYLMQGCFATAAHAAKHAADPN
ncbi:MAG: NAD(P)/FAD-dependent oxidoreductase [Akkermansiaceae bacterium]